MHLDALATLSGAFREIPRLGMCECNSVRERGSASSREYPSVAPHPNECA